MVLHPGRGQRFENAREAAARFRSSRTAAAVERNARGVAKKESQVGRAPVARYELRSAHQAGSPLCPIYIINIHGIRAPAGNLIRRATLVYYIIINIY